MTDDGIATNQHSSATLHDVAREAGVSLATASRSLNGSTRKVNEEYRQRVLAAAARLDYSPNLSAQAVARGTTTTIALLVADIADPYFSSIAAGVVAEADGARLIVTMAATERDPERELELVRTLRGQRPRVMILAGSRPSTIRPRARSAKSSAPTSALAVVVVLIAQQLDLRTVLVDNRSGPKRSRGRSSESGTALRDHHGRRGSAHRRRPRRRIPCGLAATGGDSTTTMSSAPRSPATAATGLRTLIDATSAASTSSSP